MSKMSDLDLELNGTRPHSFQQVTNTEHRQFLFDQGVRRIRAEADQMWITSLMMRPSIGAMDHYDLRASAKNLRDVADKIDAILKLHDAEF